MNKVSSKGQGEPARIYQGMSKLGMEPIWDGQICLDYEFECKLGKPMIERKAIGDALHSIQTGELNRQLSEAQGPDRIVYWLLEGPIELDGHGKIYNGNGEAHFAWNYLNEYIMDVQEAGIRFVYSPGQGATALTLRGIYDRWNDVKRGNKRLRTRPRELTFGEGYHPGLNVVLGIAGYGLERAQDVMLEFNTARRFFAASPKERLVVPGIGPSLAVEVDKALDEPYWRK